MPPMIRPRLLAALAPALLAQCASAPPPVERRSAIVDSRALALAAEHDQVDVRQLIPDIAVDLRYGTTDNLARRVIYPPDMPCLLKTATARKLAVAQETLKARGYSLRIWDAWRPPEVQQLLHSHDKDNLFLDPKSAWSRHCGGAAVDVTLVDIEGRDVPMPTAHDEGGPRAHYLYTGGSRKTAKNLHALQRAMVDAGFYILDTEWWHFDDADFYYNPVPVVFGHQLGLRFDEPAP